VRRKTGRKGVTLTRDEDKACTLKKKNEKTEIIIMVLFSFIISPVRPTNYRLDLYLTSLGVCLPGGGGGGCVSERDDHVAR